MRLDALRADPAVREAERGGLLSKQAGRAEGVTSWNPHAAFGSSLQGAQGGRQATQVFIGP